MRFPIRFDPWYGRLSAAFFIPPEKCFLEVEEQDLAVHMAWAFRARFPRSAIASTSRLEKRPASRGAHGFDGRWLVNGSGDRILVIDLAPEQRAYVMGFSVRLRQLMVSVDDPTALAAALSSRR